jgi:hypothetical protein
MDNEASAALKRMLVEKYGMSYQLVLPHIHQHNVAKSHSNFQKSLCRQAMLHTPGFFTQTVG